MTGELDKILETEESATTPGGRPVGSSAFVRSVIVLIVCLPGAAIVGLYGLMVAGFAGDADPTPFTRLCFFFWGAFGGWRPLVRYSERSLVSLGAALVGLPRSSRMEVA